MNKAVRGAVREGIEREYRERMNKAVRERV